MPDYEQIRLDVSGAIATITFDRPEKLNAWTTLMEREVADAVRFASGERAVRAIILTGSGRGFCAGADLNAAPSTADGRPAPLGGPDRFEFLWDTPKILVAAINGPAAGVGLSISLYCDFRYMAQNASLTTAFARRGLIAEHGSAWLLPRLIGLQNANDLLLTGRKVEATEAAAMGLVRLCPAEDFLAGVQQTVSKLFDQCSPRSIAVMKRQLKAALHETFAETRATTYQEQLLSLESADLREGVAAFLERRPAIFPGE